MRKSVILDIFNGKRGDRETFVMPRDTENKNLEMVCETHEELQKKLTPKQFALLEKFANAQQADLCEEIDFYFVEGFKLGLRIGIECME